MKQITTILISVLCLLESYSQTSRYYQEEFQVFDNIFLDIVDTSYYNYSGLWPLDSFKELIIEYMNDSVLNESLDYLLPPDKFEPYDIIEGLLSTNGDSLLIQELYANYDAFRDSITGLPDYRGLMIFTGDSLYKFNRNEINWINFAQSFIKYKHLDSFRYDTLKTRYFSLNELNNKGKYSFSDKPYPDQQARFATKETKELYSISFSRILFNNDFTRGAFFYTIYSDSLSASGNLVLIKKKRDKWRIYRRMTRGIS